MICDKFNFLLGLLIGLIPLCIILCGVFVYSFNGGSFQNNLEVKVIAILFTFFVVAFAIGLYFWILPRHLLDKSNQKFFLFPQSDNLSEKDEHTAIIFPHYVDEIDKLFIVDCISLLVDSFREDRENYRIYRIMQKKDFEDAYYNPNVTKLWIVGHGDRGGFEFGPNGIDGKEYIEYSKLKKVSPLKKCVVQLHCNHGKKRSLQDCNECKGFVSDYQRTFFHNRCYIINRCKKEI
jgi:hypothetical protein